MPKQNRIYMVRTALALVLVAVFFAVGGGIIYVKNQTATQTYTSEFMKIQFDYSTKFRLENKTNRVLLRVSGGNEENKIEIFQMGTMYSNALEHATKVTELNRTRVRNIVSVDSSYDGVLVERTKEEGGGKSYFFVKDYLVYAFSTDDPALFADLDTIAKSFRIVE